MEGARATDSSRSQHGASDLDSNQLRAFTAFNRGFSVAILGGAGSGKSFLLSRILGNARLRYGYDNVMACAWTNQAAVNIGGRTIHGWFGVTAGFNFEKEQLWRIVEQNKTMCDMFRKVRIIVVDEVAFLKGKILDAIDLVMRCVAETSRLSSSPIGGKQIILAGDPFQLEPIGVNYAVEGEKLVFSSRVWLLTFGGFGSGVVALLNSNHRQHDDFEFYGILNRIRHGDCTDEDIKRINCTGSRSKDAPRSHTVLCLRKAQVHSVNMRELSRIPGTEFVSQAFDKFKSTPTVELTRKLSEIAPRSVIVKSGCDVMITRKFGRVLPGTRGTVMSVRKWISPTSSSGLLSLEVRIADSKLILLITPLKFEIHDADSQVLACREQLPVVSAYALTVHRCQGLTLGKVAMDFSTVGAWIPTGMAYVALSRCTSLSGLWVRGLEHKHIVVNEFAKNVMEEIRKLRRHFVHRVISSEKAFSGAKRPHEPDIQKHKEVKRREM